MKYILILIPILFLISCKTVNPTNMKPSGESVFPSTSLELPEHLVPNDRIIHKGILNPDLDAFFYTVSDRQFRKFDIYMVKRIGNAWSAPEKAFFNSDFSDHGMSFSPDGNTLYFSSTRPTGLQNVAETWHLWKSEKIHGEWTAPEYVDIPNLREKLVSHPVLTASGNLFFHSGNTDYSEMTLYQSVQKDGKFAPATRVIISMDHPELQKCTPFVAQNENYLVFATIGDQLDLMIAYNDGKGNWINTRRLGDTINQNGQGNPSVTSDGRYLLYTTGNPDGTAWKVNRVKMEEVLQNGPGN